MLTRAIVYATAHTHYPWISTNTIQSRVCVVAPATALRQRPKAHPDMYWPNGPPNGRSDSTQWTTQWSTQCAEDIPRSRRRGVATRHLARATAEESEVTAAIFGTSMRHTLARLLLRLLPSIHRSMQPFCGDHTRARLLIHPLLRLLRWSSRRAVLTSMLLQALIHTPCARNPRKSRS